MFEREHSLVVGGSGMLAQVSVALAAGRVVSVLSRNRDRVMALDALAKAQGGQVNHIDCDYTDDVMLHASLVGAAARLGPYRRAVVWVHMNEAPNAPGIIADALESLNEGQGEPVDYFHVLSSRTARPDKAMAERLEGLRSRKGLNYKTVLLGFKVEGDVSRWLSDAEISNGVLRAMAERHDNYVVGAIEPWEKRPGG